MGLIQKLGNRRAARSCCIAMCASSVFVVSVTASKVARLAGWDAAVMVLCSVLLSASSAVCLYLVEVQKIGLHRRPPDPSRGACSDPDEGR
jgi:hypothetical protein